jgi:hypothetical protein
VIIEPRFRSLGQAVRLVKETMPLMNVPFIEALAVMGRVNPFFEKAGMTRFALRNSLGISRTESRNLRFHGDCSRRSAVPAYRGIPGAAGIDERI